MAENEKTRAGIQQAKGKAKETLGRVVGSERLVAEGRIEQTKGDARRAREKAGDAFRH
ncbi:CsbD family protein [Streptomyces sp. NPDC048566]|uniref:CsbD family protein n=1 Tax=Streptomyces sp. NPDC048566 TaxID=3365569 RepID=UPI003721E8A2